MAAYAQRAVRWRTDRTHLRDYAPLEVPPATRVDSTYRGSTGADDAEATMSDRHDQCRASGVKPAVGRGEGQKSGRRLQHSPRRASSARRRHSAWSTSPLLQVNHASV